MFHKIKNFLFLLIIFFPLFLLAEEELKVLLPTQSSLAFLYHSPIYTVQSDFEQGYVRELQKILHWDLDQSGIFLVQNQDPNKDLLLSKPKPEDAFDAKTWKKEKVAYVIKAISNHKELELQVYNPYESYLRQFKTSLTGRLEEDRRKIHHLCDYLLAELSGKKGVASGRILYTVRYANVAQNAPPWISEVWVCDSDGSNAHPVTREGHYAVHPLFLSSQYPQDFIYVSYKEGQPKIYRFIASKGKSVPLISLRGNQILPALSHARDCIAFISDAAGRPDLFLQKINGQGETCGPALQLFSFPRATQASPSFSPDGKKIAFVSDKDGPPRIYIIQIPEDISFHKRPIAQLITKKNRENVSPAWSPDGTKLAYSAKVEGVRQIWIYDFQRDEEWQLTKGSGNKENPSWANDSLHLVYNTEDQNSGELYVIDLNRQIPVKITSGFGKKRFPCWEPF